ncbi:unnamed protein product [Phytomonas sp. EM1]|nr:unnamed protein product [Phytomonas sp. EM1]|eukprot:CCW63212.1 unnamed protein product [Phytomonas sp. isolate EM1]
MIDFKDELDASLEFGSGYICLIGPPSSGKTTSLLEYLTSREEAFDRGRTSPAGVEVAEEVPGGSGAPCLHLEYLSARNLCGDALAYLSRRLQLKPTRRRLVYDCTPIDFGFCVAQWLKAHPRGSELHLVLDDADLLEESPDAIDLWLSNCLQESAARGSLVCLWLIMQMPLRLANCFRFHVMSPPRVEGMCAWLEEEYSRNNALLLQDGRQGANDAVENGDAEANAASKRRRDAELTHRCMMQAMYYYTTHQPMRSSVICKNKQMLLKRVYQLLPALLSAVNGDVSKLNAVHYVGVWGRFKEIANIANRPGENPAGEGRPDLSIAPRPPGPPEGVDPLVRALKRISYAAVLLAFAAFYCGAVPRGKQLQVFSKELGEGRRGRKTAAEANAQSHKAAVLSASAHVITVQRLLLIYKAMRRMCEAHLDSLELTSSKLAAHYIPGFVSWGLLTPAVSQRRKKFHCWIPVSTAQQLGSVLSLNLFELIPT